MISGRKVGNQRATRLVTPGELQRTRKRAIRFTESATENKPPVEWSTVASRRETCKTSRNADSAVRVKRWGKSPPLVWRQTRHGKPRVVQGQIGGESRPGSMSASSCCCGASRD